MAMVYGGGTSRLNPNAPLYIPAALRKVEDFSQEWWNLITTSHWYRNYWLSQHQEVDVQTNVVDDIVDLLPDDIDLGVDEEVLCMESQYEEFIQSYKEKLPANEATCNPFLNNQEKPMNSASFKRPQ